MTSERRAEIEADLADDRCVRGDKTRIEVGAADTVRELLAEIDSLSVAAACAINDATLIVTPRDYRHWIGRLRVTWNSDAAGWMFTTTEPAPSQTDASQEDV